MVLKESQIRKYIRSLIREALETEHRLPSEESRAEIEKMESGKPYDRTNFAPAALRREKAYREQMGYPSISDWENNKKQSFKDQTGKTLGAINVSTVGADGNPTSVVMGHKKMHVSVDDMFKTREEYLTSRAAEYGKRSANRYLNVADRKAKADERGVDYKQINSMDSTINNADKDPKTRIWLNMTVDERERIADKIRRKRMDKQFQKNDEIRKSISKNSPGRFEDLENTKSMIDRVNMLKTKRDELHRKLGGKETDLNRREWTKYDHVIKDNVRILDDYLFDQNVICKYFDISPEEYQNNEIYWRHEYNDEYTKHRGKAPKGRKSYRGKDNGINTNDDMADKITTDAENDNMDGINNDFAEEYGDNVLNPNDFARNVQQQEIPTIDDYDDDDNRGGGRDFDDAEEMGLFDDEDDDEAFANFMKKYE